jgi:pimeloyl-ACP methyl ester carboxylesterase
MTSRFYDQLSLRGNSIVLDYGSYTFIQLAPLNNILSMSLGGFVKVTMYTRDNFRGRKNIISNLNKKDLKVAGFFQEFDFPIRSMKIDCSCKANSVDRSVKYIITKNFFMRNGQNIAYTFYDVIPEPLTDIFDNPSPYNPTVFIIPDFGEAREDFECFQEKLALRRVSSLIIDTRGVGQSYSATSVTYGDIIQDYKFIATQLDQYRKKPIVIGCGYGGAIAQLWALTYKFEIAQLILIGSAPYAIYRTYNNNDSNMILWSTNLLPASSLAPLISNSAYNIPSDEADIHKLKEALEDSIQTPNQSTLKLYYTQNPDNILLANSPQYIQTKTLLIHGLQDAYIPISGSNTLYSLIPNVKYRKINSGHAPHFTNPCRTLEIIFSILSPDGSIYFTLRDCPLKCGRNQ